MSSHLLLTKPERVGPAPLIASAAPAGWKLLSHALNTAISSNWRRYLNNLTAVYNGAMSKK